ncbi:hypothetical protein KSS87_015284, partial [Heliosperma pusillum]
KYKRRSKEKTWNQKVEMGGSSEWLKWNDFCPNGLVVEEADSISRPLDSRRWAIAEERTTELISRIQPNRLSVMHRNAVASYVQRLVSKCVPCQVVTFGSVPLKTYLPDGDIDLTAFSEDPNLKDNWAKEVQNMLLMEEKNEQAEFPVKEVQLIQAEVKLIKCLVDNIVVDISFNQLGGLCTLCFLEEIDYLISKNHLFKRSIILIKAWCYYESRILGAHHGLISTYALETLVLYIFHVYNNSFDGPLEVLYRFLEFFSKFDWANFCVSLRGPVPICSLPNMAAAPPRKDGGDLLLSKMFLDSCGTAYSALPAVPENRENHFTSKHLNVIDPLRLNNNLGRSVNKGNFFRIRSAFGLGAQQLAKILERPVEDIVPELNRFFMNTWDRHGKGCRPDAPILDFSPHAPEVDESHQSLGHSAQPNTIPLLPTVGANSSPPKQNDHYHTERRKLWKKQHDDIKRTCRMNTLHTNGHTTHHFARTSSSPELTSMSMSSDAAFNYRRNVATVKLGDDPSSRSGNSRRMIDAGTRENHAPPIRESSSRHSLASGSDHSSVSCMPSSSAAVVSSVHESRHRCVEGQDIQNKLSSTGIQHYGGHAQMPVNLASHPFPPSIMGYSHPNYATTVPTNVSSVESNWGTVMNYSNDPFSVPLRQQLRPIRVVAEHDKVIRGLNDRAVSQEADRVNEHTGFWINSNGHSNMEFDPESEDVCSTSSRLMPASPSTSSRTQASSESSWDGKPGKSTYLPRYPAGKKSSSTRNPGLTVNRRWEEDEEPVAHNYSDRQKDWVPSGPVEVNQMTRFGRPQMICQNSMSPYGSLLVHPGSHQGVLPVAFYPAGPHVPFVTVVPIYHIPAETVSSGGPSSPNNMEKEQLSRTEYYDSKNMIASREHSEESAPDIFNSDFANHWKNLQYGRFCQDSQLRHPFMYPPAVLVPQLPLQGTSSVVSPGRSSSFTHAVPVSAPQSGSVKPVGASRRYGGTVSKQRNGTGTYFPNPNMIKERQSPTPRQYRWDYSQERNEIDTDREPNWNSNSKPRYNGRAQPRNY